MAAVQRGEAGVHTVEGSVAGHAAARLAADREKQQAEYSRIREEIAGKTATRILPRRVDEKFVTRKNHKEKDFSSDLVGLRTLHEYRTVQQGMLLPSNKSKSGQSLGTGPHERKKRKRVYKSSLLSFGSDSSDEEEVQEKPDRHNSKQRRLSERGSEKSGSPLLGGFPPKSSPAPAPSSVTHGSSLAEPARRDGSSSKVAASVKLSALKNPDVDTSFLPDWHREQAMQMERARLRQEYVDLQEKLRVKPLEITYSWWNGTGHRRSIVVPQGTTIHSFLEKCRLQLVREFPDLRRLSADNLMYIKEDLIMPGHHTFYELIKTKARGKSGPLFHFDVHEDVRVGPLDSRVEKDESHPGKVLERSWYERNKHIFPASRWEVFDPDKDYGEYTIGGNNVR